MILAQYTFIFYSYGYLLITIFAGIRLLTKQKIYVNKYLTLYIVVCFIMQIFLYLGGGENSGFSIILIYFIIIILYDDIDENELMKSYKIFGTIAIIGLLYQSFSIYILDIPSPPFKILPIDAADQHFWGEGERPSSFFAEPQAYCSFIIPMLFLYLKNNKKLLSIIITVSILLSTSTQGLAMAAVIWGGYIFLHVPNTKKRIALLFLLVSISILYINLDVFNYSREKIVNTNLDDNIRLSRGFQIYNSLDTHDKIFGLGLGGAHDYMEKNSSLFEWSQNNTQYHLLGYTTGVSGTLVSFGLIGGLCLLIMFLRFLKFEDKRNRIFMIMIIMIFFSQNILFNAWFLYFFLFYLGINNKEKNSNYIKVWIRK